MSSQIARSEYRKLLFFLFALSGFSGLIYESIWTHYLKLFLGHAAYSQSVVLAIFMGGMALGSWLSARLSGRWTKLLSWYALTEGIIGAFALVFHEGFDQAVQFSFNSIIPLFTSPWIVLSYKWALSAALIFPQSVLLGMTFPLMSAGILRAWPEKPGSTLALLYFTNSLGAALGVLSSGFFLIRFLGLPGTIRVAGILNIALALVVLRISKKVPQTGAPGEQEDYNNNPAVPLPSNRVYAGFLAASLLTGAASFLYEIGWIRMLSLVLGSSTHAFELMLCAFILGLACGGLWIQRRIDRLTAPVRFLGWLQVAMGLFALSTLLTYGITFRVMQIAFETIEKSDGGYVLFNLVSHGLALAVMLPATFCAGTTLPLITFVLLRRGYGERSIGAVYAANTLGAIAGVFLAMHVGFPLLGLKGVILAGAFIDAALGIALLWVAGGKAGQKLRPALATAGVAAALVSVVFLVHLDTYKMASGVYRNGNLLSSADVSVLSHRDGKTATVSVTRGGNILSIRTNGKVDAGISVDPEVAAIGDEDTMILSAVLPLSLHPQARTVANIGMGCGLTTHTLLLYPGLEEVDTIEIEREMVESARLFGHRVERGFTDTRSRIHIDDAKSFFSATHRKYDIIISEPSNPWVSGVAGLFSIEFYREVRRHLAADGLFVQWMQLYEIDMNLVISVLKAVSESFPDYVVYAPNTGDILIVAKNQGSLPPPDPAVLHIPEIAAALERISIRAVQDIEFRKVGDRNVLRRLLETSRIPANSDYEPFLDQHASKARFLKAKATEILMYAHVPIPAFEILSDSSKRDTRTEITPSISFGLTLMAHSAMGIRDYYLTGKFDPKYEQMPSQIRENAVLLKKLFFKQGIKTDETERLTAIYNTGAFITPFLTPNELDAIWKYLESGPNAKTLTKVEKDWLALFKAVGHRNAQGMAAAAGELLPNSSKKYPTMFKYLVTAGAIGTSKSRGREALERTWGPFLHELRDKGESRFLLQLLL